MLFGARMRWGLTVIGSGPACQLHLDEGPSVAAMVFQWGGSHILQSVDGCVSVNGAALPEGERIVLRHHDQVVVQGLQASFMAPRAASYRGTVTVRRRSPTLLHLRHNDNEYIVDALRPFTIGASRDCDLCLANDLRASNVHCRVFWDRGWWWLEDLGSRQGTQLDGVGVQLAGLNDATHDICIGATILSVRTARPEDIDTRRHGVVAESASFRAVFEGLKRAAELRLNVLLLGEVGTGKNLLAQAYHAESRPAGGPLIVLRCATTTPRSLYEQMLGDQESTLDRAAGGTLFLDDMGSLDIKMQRELLPVLMGNSRYAIRRHGANPRVQVVAATHRDPTMLLEAGLLDRTFYQNLGARIEVPPLRERPEDILAIARDTLWEKRQRLSHWGARALVEHTWPRNIPELQGVLRRVIHACPANGTIDAVDLEKAMGHGPRSGSTEEQD